MTPKAVRPEIKRVKPRDAKDSPLIVDYRSWISFQGSRSADLAPSTDAGPEHAPRKRNGGPESD